MTYKFAKFDPTDFTKVVTTATIIGSILRPVTTITGGTTTAIVMTETLKPPPRITTNSVGSTIVVLPPPVQAVKTVTGVLGGDTIQTLRPDDGLMAEISIITAVVGGLPVVLLAVSVPGRVITTDIATVVNGTPTTIKTAVTVTPTSTRTIPPPGSEDTNSGVTQVRLLPGFTPAQYFTVTYLPTLIVACLVVPFSIISTNVKLMQPFHTLATRQGGSPCPDTLILCFRGYWGVPTSLIQALWRREPLPLITDLSVVLSSLLAPLAAETISFKAHGTCSHLDIASCGIAPGVSPVPTSALLALMVVLLGVVMVLALLLAVGEGRACRPGFLGSYSIAVTESIVASAI